MDADTRSKAITDMTEEQIRKQAEERFPDSLNMQSAYIEGIKSMSRVISQRLWTSVEKKLPKAGKLPTEEQYINNKSYWDKKTMPVYLVAYIYDGDICYHFANYVKYPDEKKPRFVFCDEDIRSNRITHWMPLPLVDEPIEMPIYG